ncbi:ABC transporter permease [Streptomyces sp. NPDC017966]|uniref:ABC transporter permease n=1 Tax=Streptomyces sp. NPDC017966 TaxID=3365023 RepID=UPI0037A03048
MRSGGLAGLRELSKLATRRDRIILPLWAYALIGSAVSTASSIKGLFPDEASRRDFVEGIQAASGAVALYGRVSDTSLGAITTWRSLVLGAVLASVMSVLLVVRHTRAEEQTGRQELVAAGVVDRRAPLVAALRLVIAANLAVGVIIGALLPAVGLPAAGSFALGLSMVACGIVFAGIAAVCAQLFEASRTANAASLALLGGFYLVRAAGDMSEGARWLLWASPIGWAEEVRPYAGDRWWALAVPVAAAVALIALSLRMLARRDFGSGVLPARPGPAYAGSDTRGTLGLAWRLHRGSLLGWAIGVLAAALVFGSFVRDVDVLTDSDRVQDIMAQLGGSQNMADAYVSSIVGVFGILAAVYALTVIVRARAEEAGGRIELIFSGTPSRARWVLSHLAFAVAGAVVILAVAAFGMGLSQGLGAHDVGTALADLFGAVSAQLPAVLLITALAVLLFAVVPRWTAAGWGVLGLFGFLTLVGPQLKVSQYVLDVSPFTHVPKLPGNAVSATPLVVMGALALVGVAATLVAFRRRDLLA